jgi:hypothetical protein
VETMLARHLFGALKQPASQAGMLGCANLFPAYWQRLSVNMHFANDSRSFQVGQTSLRRLGTWQCQA